MEHINKENLPTDGQIKLYEDYDKELDCGNIILFPRGDGSLLIDRIGPMIGRDNCNTIHMDINPNDISRVYETSFKNVLLAAPNIHDENGNSIRIASNYIMTEQLFKLFDEAYSGAVDELIMFCNKLNEEEFILESPNNSTKLNENKYVKGIIDNDTQLHIGMCLMCNVDNNFTFYKLVNHSRTYGNIMTVPDWDARTFHCGKDRLWYRPLDSFFPGLINHEFESPEPFGCKRIVYIEITPEAFDIFEEIYSRNTKNIQALREMTVNAITEIDFANQIYKNNKPIEY